MKERGVKSQDSQILSMCEVHARFPGCTKKCAVLINMRERNEGVELLTQGIPEAPGNQGRGILKHQLWLQF